MEATLVVSGLEIGWGSSSSRPHDSDDWLAFDRNDTNVVIPGVLF